MVTQDVNVSWDGVVTHVPAGTVVDVPAGSALEAAYGAALEPLASQMIGGSEDVEPVEEDV
jgi:hypothetical protein